MKQIPHITAACIPYIIAETKPTKRGKKQEEKDLCEWGIKAMPIQTTSSYVTQIPKEKNACMQVSLCRIGIDRRQYQLMLSICCVCVVIVSRRPLSSKRSENPFSGGIE